MINEIKKRKMILLITITFFLIFDFPLIKGIRLATAEIIIFFLLICYSIINKEYFKEVVSLLLKRKCQKIWIWGIFIMFYSALVAIFSGTMDFGLVVVFLHHFLTVISCFFLFALFRKMYVEKQSLEILIYTFVVQSVIQFFSFLFPKFWEFTNVFRFDTTVQKSISKYSGYRGLSISSTSFFGLCAAYSILYVLLFFKWQDWQCKKQFVKLVVALLLIVGGALTGRTAVIGAVIAGMLRLVMQLLQTRKIRIKKRKFTIFCISFIAVIGVVVIGFHLLSPLMQSEKLFRYLTQDIRNYLAGNGFTSSSSERLKTMYFSVPLSTMIAGTGHYVGESGSGYYMKTDAGYMRNMLYFGIVGFVFLVLYQLSYLRFDKRKNFFVNISVMIMLFILHYKGEVIGYSVICSKMITLFMLYQDYETEDIPNEKNVEKMKGNLYAA